MGFLKTLVLMFFLICCVSAIKVEISFAQDGVKSLKAELFSAHQQRKPCVGPLKRLAELDEPAAAAVLLDFAEMLGQDLLKGDFNNISPRETGLSEQTAEALSTFQNEKAQKVIRDGLNSKNIWLSMVCAQALGLSKNNAALDALEKKLFERNVSCALKVRLIESLGNFEDQSSLPVLSKAAAECGDWETQSAVIRSLEKIGSAKAVPALLKLAEAERLRVQVESFGALARLTGQNFRKNLTLWKEWYEKNKDGIGKGTFVPGKEDVNEGDSALSYHGIPIDSDRIIFVMDVSNSMVPGKPKADGSKDIPEGVETKLSLAKRELSAVIQKLPETTKFNMVFFHAETLIWSKSMAPATEKNRKAALAAIEKVGINYGTNTWLALTDALAVAGLDFGKQPKAALLHGAEKSLGADTIFLLSDGHPVGGAVNEDKAMLDYFSALNRHIRINVHSIFLTNGVKTDGAKLMKDLAAENGGRFVKITVEGGDGENDPPKDSADKSSRNTWAKPEKIR